MAPADYGITIRPATTGDVDRISRLITQLSRQFITPDYTPVGTASLLSHQTPEAIANLLDEGVRYLLAESDEVLVGAAGLMVDWRHLYHLFVDAAHQGRGIGRRLWNKLRSGLGTGPITVNSSRLAIGFYERLGFVSSGPAWEKEGVIAWPMVWEAVADS